MMRRSLFCLAMVAVAVPLWAGDLVLQKSDSIARIEVGVFCRPKELGRNPAPETRLGYVSSSGEVGSFSEPGQQVPAALGVSFGVRSMAARDIDPVRIVLLRPDQGKPDVWADTFHAGAENIEFFAFDFPDEMVTGNWVFEAWDGEELLYKVGFTVVPEVTMPDLVAKCQGVS